MRGIEEANNRIALLSLNPLFMSRPVPSSQMKMGKAVKKAVQAGMFLSEVFMIDWVQEAAE